MVLHAENPKDATKKYIYILLELKNDFSKVAGYKINTFKKLLLSHTLILSYQKEKAKKKIPFKITSKRIKYLGISLTKKVKRLILCKL